MDFSKYHNLKFHKNAFTMDTGAVPVEEFMGEHPHGRIDVRTQKLTRQCPSCGIIAKGEHVVMSGDKRIAKMYCRDGHAWEAPPARFQLIRCKYTVEESNGVESSNLPARSTTRKVDDHGNGS